MPHPEGYRKALRLMKQAEKFNRPIICFVDTPGAFCGIEAEERGQGEAIAQNLLVMSKLKTPIISIIIGEGGSGGALALAVANKVYRSEERRVGKECRSRYYLLKDLHQYFGRMLQEQKKLVRL